MNSHWKFEKENEAFNQNETPFSTHRKNIYLTFGFLLLILLLCLINLIILIILYSVLNIQLSGMSSMSFFKNQGEIKWMLDADFETISLSSSTIDGFSDQDVVFQGNNQDIEFSAEDSFRSSMKVTNKGTFLRTENFKFFDPSSQKSILDLNGASLHSVIGEFDGKSIQTDVIRTPRVVSDDKTDLSFLSLGGNISMTGNQGFYGDFKNLHTNAVGDVLFNIKNKNFDLIFDGFFGGIRVNPARIPNAALNGTPISNVKKYRLCLCTKTDQLFRVEIKSDKLTCAIANENPC